MSDCKKVRYGHKETAERACAELAATKGRTGLTAYACDRCGGWHIGHKAGDITVLIEWLSRQHQYKVAKIENDSGLRKIHVVLT